MLEKIVKVIRGCETDSPCSLPGNQLVKLLPLAISCLSVIDACKDGHHQSHPPLTHVVLFTSIWESNSLSLWFSISVSLSLEREKLKKLLFNSQVEFRENVRSQNLLSWEVKLFTNLFSLANEGNQRFAILKICSFGYWFKLVIKKQKNQKEPVTFTLSCPQG